MPFSVITLMREPGTVASASIWALIRVVSSESLLRTSSEVGCCTCSSLCTLLTLFLARRLFCHGFQVAARSLASEQNHAVIAGDHDARCGAGQVDMGAGDVGADLRGDKLVVDLVADATVATAGEGQGQCQGGEDQW